MYSAVRFAGVSLKKKYYYILLTVDSEKVEFDLSQQMNCLLSNLVPFSLQIPTIDGVVIASPRLTQMPRLLQRKVFTSKMSCSPRCTCVYGA